jgi:hypothetical protein
MRFMMSLPAPAKVLEDFAPSKEIVIPMRKFNDDMRKAGVLLVAEGLHPPSRGARIRVTNGKRIVTDGPYAETKEVIAGFWMIQVKSKEEAIEWASKCPLPDGGIVELRQIFENTDFPPDLRDPAAR